MGTPIKFEGATHEFHAPPGEEERCGSLHCFLNGSQVVSAWQLDPVELQRVIDSGGIVFVSVWSGTSVLPLYVGDESSTAAVVSDFGKVWR